MSLIICLLEFIGAFAFAAAIITAFVYVDIKNGLIVEKVQEDK